MKSLYLDCGMGAAGDMLAAALLELHPDRDGFIRRMNNMGLHGVKISAEKLIKCGICGTHFSVSVHVSVFNLTRAFNLKVYFVQQCTYTHNLYVNSL